MKERDREQTERKIDSTLLCEVWIGPEHPIKRSLRWWNGIPWIKTERYYNVFRWDTEGKKHKVPVYSDYHINSTEAFLAAGEFERQQKSKT